MTSFAQCVDALLRSLNCPTIDVAVKRFGVQGANAQFQVRARAHIAAGPVYRSMRVGLSLKTKTYDSNTVQMWCAALRFLVEPPLISKHRHLLALELLAAAVPPSHASIAATVGSNERNIAQWASAYHSGANRAASSYCGAKAGGVADICACFAACRAD